MTIRSIRKTLIRHDLEGLLALGAPKDEYDQEAKLIFNRVSGDMKPHELSEVIRDVFHDQFSGLSTYDYSTLITMASEILEG